MEGQDDYCGLMTNYHILGGRELESALVCRVEFEENGSWFNLLLSEVEYTYAKKNLDCTFVVLQQHLVHELKERGIQFLATGYEEFAKTIGVIGHPGGGQISFSYGQIESINNNGCDMYHTADTLPGSSGSPLINERGKDFKPLTSVRYAVTISRKTLLKLLANHLFSSEETKIVYKAGYVGRLSGTERLLNDELSPVQLEITVADGQMKMEFMGGSAGSANLSFRELLWGYCLRSSRVECTFDFFLTLPDSRLQAYNRLDDVQPANIIEVPGVHSWQPSTCSMPRSYMCYFPGKKEFEPPGTDCCIRAEGKDFYCHSLVLEKRCSKMWSSLFGTGVERSHAEIRDFPHASVEIFLWLIYEPMQIIDCIFLDPASRLFDVYRLAQLYEASWLVELCEKTFPFINIDEDSFEDALCLLQSHPHLLDRLRIPVKYWDSDMFASFAKRNLVSASRILRRAVSRDVFQRVMEDVVLTMNGPRMGPLSWLFGGTSGYSKNLSQDLSQSLPDDL